jgi:signal transduction histidine kinase
MDKLSQLRGEQLRYAALTSIEKHLGLAVKYVLIAIALLVTGFIRPYEPLFYIYLGIFICGTLCYTYLYRRFLSTHRVTIMTISSCLEIFCISFLYCTVVRGNLVPIVFLFFSLPILRLILFYPAALELLLAAGSSSVVFVFVTASLSPQQLGLPWFWAYFAATWLIIGLGITISDRLLTQFNQSVKNRRLILQAFQMVSSLIEMAQSTAHLREENSIFQRSVEIISATVKAVHSCVAWVYQDGRLYPAASEGLDREQVSKFEEMELSVSDVPIFDRALTQNVPIVVTDGDLAGTVPVFYRQCFQIRAMLVVPLTDLGSPSARKRKEEEKDLGSAPAYAGGARRGGGRALGCIALHWRTSPEKITSQELAILSGIVTQVGITLENVYLLEELREKEEIRGRLLERVISIQERERERIARELHDETGQILTALMVNVELFRTEPEFQTAKSQERLDEISSLLSRTMEDIHNLSLDLHPKILNELGLVPAIRWYAKNHLERWGIDFNISANSLNHNLSTKEEICLFRVAQEAITNVIRHAQAQRVDIEIDIDAENVFLNIKDDGRGFNAKGVSNSQSGEVCLGLRSMEERVSFLDGQMDIRSEIGKGTEVSVNIPLRGQDEFTAEIQRSESEDHRAKS